MQIRRSVPRIVEVEGLRYSWTVRREPQWSSIEGWKGPSIEVSCVDIGGRTLLLELPFQLAASRSVPYRQRPKVTDSEIRLHIAEAISGGWLPGSRGKPFVFEIHSSPA